MTETEPRMDRQRAVDSAVHGSRDDRSHRLLYALVVVAVVGVLALFGWGYTQNQRSSDLATAVADLAGQQSHAAVVGQQLAAQLKGLGVKPSAIPPMPVTVTQEVSPVAVSQTDIDGSVGRYFAVHPLPPGQLPPVSEVAGLVAQYLVTNPPAPGQNATPQMVSDAVAGYCSGHNGCAGSDGQNATDEQVATQVSAYCATHDDCAGASGKDGKDGATGAQGVSITDLVFRRDNAGACQAIVTLHDPATGSDNTVSHPAGDAACPLISTPLIHGR